MLDVRQNTYQGQNYFPNTGNQFWGQFNGTFSGTLSGTINASQIVPGTFQAGTFLGNSGGTTFGTTGNPITFVGNGAGLTGLKPANIVSGTFPASIALNLNGGDITNGGFSGTFNFTSGSFTSGTFTFASTPAFTGTANFSGATLTGGTYGTSGSPAAFYGNGTFGTGGGGSSFNGNGSALMNLTAANISAGTAGINISGNAATASTAGLATTVLASGILAGDFGAVNLLGCTTGQTTIGGSGDPTPIIFWGSFNSASGVSSEFDGDFDVASTSTTSFHGATTFYGANVSFSGDITLNGSSSTYINVANGFIYAGNYIECGSGGLGPIYGTLKGAVDVALADFSVGSTEEGTFTVLAGDGVTVYTLTFTSGLLTGFS